MHERTQSRAGSIPLQIPFSLVPKGPHQHFPEAHPVSFPHRTPSPSTGLQALLAGGAPSSAPSAPPWGWPGAVSPPLPKTKDLDKDLGFPGGGLTEANTAFLSGVT